MAFQQQPCRGTARRHRRAPAALFSAMSVEHADDSQGDLGVARRNPVGVLAGCIGANSSM